MIPDAFERERARAATRRVQAYRSDKSFDLEKYAKTLRSSQIDLRSLGMIQWTGYLLSKAWEDSGKDLSARGQILADLFDWLANESRLPTFEFLRARDEPPFDTKRKLRHAPEDIITRLLALSSHQIAWLELEAGAYLEWLGRMALAFCPPKSKRKRNEAKGEKNSEMKQKEEQQEEGEKSAHG